MDATEEVQMNTFDLLELSKCDFIKIDVAGAETSVIRGATTTIRRHGPTISAQISEEDCWSTNIYTFSP